MRLDIGQPVRKAFFDAINEQITNPEGGVTAIPIVDQKLDDNISDHDLYILIGQQSEPDPESQVKTHWVGEVDITLTIVNRRKATNSKVLVENIAGQILAILFPEKNSFGITLADPFKLSYVKKTTSEYQFNKLESGWEINKQTTFKIRLTQ